LGFIDKEVGEIAWCGHNVSAENLLVFSPDGDNECVSRPGFSGHLVSFREEYLELTAESLGFSWEIGRYRDGGSALEIDPVQSEDLRRRLCRLGDAVTRVPPSPQAGWVRQELEHEIAVRVLRLFANEPTARCAPIDGVKVVAARRAHEFIDSHAAECPSIGSVCQAAEVSWRTLNYAFRELFGVTPKQYLQATRLDGVRKRLRRLRHGAKITDVANAWGFWHMGQFAKDYKRQFGELPSEATRRAANS